MTTYICKCGKEIRKSCKADVTGHKLDGYGTEHECYGCPYAYQVDRYTIYPQMESYQECATCKVRKTITTHSGLFQNYNVAEIHSLDFDFLQTITDFCEKTPYLSATFMPVRKANYNSNGDLTLAIIPTRNKSGINAKVELYCKFFNDDGTRMDTNGADETEMIMAQIERGKAQAKMALIDIDKCTNPLQEVISKMETTTKPATEESSAVVTDTDVGDIPEDKRTTLVASPLDAVSAALAPAFDYSTVDEKTADVLMQAKQRVENARKFYVSECAYAVAMAHDALCVVATSCRNSKHANRGNETFGVWCESVGLSRRTAERLLQVHALFNGSSDEEQMVLENAPITLLYAASKANAPAELVHAVKQGEITSHAEYKKLLAKNKATEAERDEFAEKLNQRDAELLQASNTALQAQEDAQKAKDDFEVASELIQKKVSENARLKREAFESAERTTQLERKVHELESRPVDVAVQQPSEDDIERWRQEGREQQNVDHDAETQCYRDMLAERQGVIEDLRSQVDPQDKILFVSQMAAQTMQSALKGIFDACIDEQDMDIIEKAVMPVQNTYEAFLDSMESGEWKG